jgi:hypothetical protein
VVWLLVPGRVPRALARLEWAAFTAMLMALSTGPTPYHLCVLILAAALGLDALLADGRHGMAVALVMLYGTVCFPWTHWAAGNANGWHMFLASPRVYPLLALPFVLYGAIYFYHLVRAPFIVHRREIWAFSGAFGLLVVVGFLQAFHHERGQFENYSRRLFAVPGSLFQSEAAVSANGLYFTRMPGDTPSFETWRWSGSQFRSLRPAEDEFHPTSAPTLADVWIEAAGPVSNIVRFSHVKNAGALPSQIEVVDGEQPSISADGKWLAFVREKRGRGELWIKQVAQNPNLPGGEERRIVDDSYDVWEAAFEPGEQRIIFTSAPKGQPELYSYALDSLQITPLPIAGPARYPAISRDGKWLAYSRSEHGIWHLYVTQLPSGSSRRLEYGDCNSVSPAWEQDSKSLIYAIDCGRGLEMPALARIEISTEHSD